MEQYTTVNAPDGTQLRFPSSMSQDEILGVMREKYPPGTVANAVSKPTTQAPSMMERAAGLSLKVDNMKKSGKLGVANAITLGFADEIGGLLGGEETRDTIRDEMNTARDRNPKSFFAGEMLGAGAAGGAGLVKQGGLKTAALAGGAYGAGNNDGSITERAVAGLGGAVAGAAGYGAVKLATPVVSKAASNLASKFLARRGSAKVNLTRPQRKALAMLRDAARKDGFDFDDRMTELAEQGLKNDAMVFEKFGPNVRNVALGTATSEGPAQASLLNKLTARQKRQRPFVAARLKEIMGADDFTVAKDKLSESFKKVGSPLYKEVLPQPVKITPGLADLLQRDGMSDVLKKAASNASREGRKLDPNTVDFLHTVKLAVDDKVTGEARSNGQRAASSSWKSISNALVDEIEAQAPDYAVARKYWAGAKADEAALALGRKAFNPSVDIEDIIEASANMSESERAFLKAGMFRAARQKVTAKTSGGNAAGGFDRLDLQEKFNAVLDPDEAKEAFSLFDDIAEQTKNRRLIDTREGSPTQIRQEADKAMQTKLGKALSVATPERASNAAATGGMSEVGSGINALLRKGSKVDDATKTALVDLLTENPSVVRSLTKSQRSALDDMLTPKLRARLKAARQRAADAAPLASGVGSVSALDALTAAE